MGSKGHKLRVIAGRLCMATVMMVPFFTGQLHASGEGVRSHGGLIQSVYEHIKDEVTLLDLNDPVPKI